MDRKTFLNSSEEFSRELLSLAKVVSWTVQRILAKAVCSDMPQNSVEALWLQTGGQKRGTCLHKPLIESILSHKAANSFGGKERRRRRRRDEREGKKRRKRDEIGTKETKKRRRRRKGGEEEG